MGLKIVIVVRGIKHKAVIAYDPVVSKTYGPNKAEVCVTGILTCVGPK
jgi:hypothetical protein